MLVKIIFFLLLIILVILLSINICILCNVSYNNSQHKNKKIYGGDCTIYTQLLTFLNGAHRNIQYLNTVKGYLDTNVEGKSYHKQEDKYLLAAYPVMLLKDNDLAPINSKNILDILTDKPITYAEQQNNKPPIKWVIDNDNVDLIRENWKHLPTTALSSISVFINKKNKYMDIYYIGSIYYINKLNINMYIDMISLLLLEANRRAIYTKAYIISTLLFDTNISILKCYCIAVQNTLCSNIDTIEIYMPNVNRAQLSQQGMPPVSNNKGYYSINFSINQQSVIILKIVVDDKIRAEANIDKLFYSNTVVKHYINNGVSYPGNLYWLCKPNIKYIPPVQYAAEFEAANNSLIPFVHNPKINSKYNSNVKNRSIVFYNNTSNLDWELSYDSIKYIENIKLFIQNYEVLSVLLDIKKTIMESDNNLIQYLAYVLVMNTIKKDEYGIEKTSEMYNIMDIQDNFKEIYDILWDRLGGTDADKYRHIDEIYENFGKKNGHIDFSNILKKKLKDGIIKLKGDTDILLFIKTMNDLYFKLQKAIYMDAEDAEQHKGNLRDNYKLIYTYVFDYYQKIIDLNESYKLFHLYPKISKDILLIKKIISTFQTDDEKLLFILPFLFLWENRTHKYFFDDLVLKENNIDEYFNRNKINIWNRLYKMYISNFKNRCIDKWDFHTYSDAEEEFSAGRNTGYKKYKDLYKLYDQKFLYLFEDDKNIVSYIKIKMGYDIQLEPQLDITEDKYTPWEASNDKDWLDVPPPEEELSASSSSSASPSSASPSSSSASSSASSQDPLLSRFLASAASSRPTHYVSKLAPASKKTITSFLTQIKKDIFRLCSTHDNSNNAIKTLNDTNDGIIETYLDKNAGGFNFRIVYYDNGDEQTGIFGEVAFTEDEKTYLKKLKEQLINIKTIIKNILKSINIEKEKVKKQYDIYYNYLIKYFCQFIEKLGTGELPEDPPSTDDLITLFPELSSSSSSSSSSSASSASSSSSSRSRSHAEEKASLSSRPYAEEKKWDRQSTQYRNQQPRDRQSPSASKVSNWETTTNEEWLTGDNKWSQSSNLATTTNKAQLQSKYIKLSSAPAKSSSASAKLSSASAKLSSASAKSSSAPAKLSSASAKSSSAPAKLSSASSELPEDEKPIKYILYKKYRNSWAYAGPDSDNDDYTYVYVDKGDPRLSKEPESDEDEDEDDDRDEPEPEPGPKEDSKKGGGRPLNTKEVIQAINFNKYNSSQLKNIGPMTQSILDNNEYKERYISNIKDYKKQFNQSCRDIDSIEKLNNVRGIYTDIQTLENRIKDCTMRENKLFRDIYQVNANAMQVLAQEHMEQMERDRIEQDQMAQVHREHINQIKVPNTLEILANVQQQSSSGEGGIYPAIAKNSYTDKLLTLFEWFSHVPNNNIILTLNISNIKKTSNSNIYFIPINPMAQYLYNNKLYSEGDYISIDALKSIPNGTYYYKGNELYFE